MHVEVGPLCGVQTRLTGEYNMNRRGSLNRIYCLIWSQVTNTWVTVAESVKGRGKGKNAARKLAAAAMSAVTWLIPEAVAG